MRQLARLVGTLRVAGSRGFHASGFACGGARPGGRPVFSWKQRKELGIDYEAYASSLGKKQPLYEFSTEFDLTGYENVTGKDFRISRTSTPEEDLQAWRDSRKKIKILVSSCTCLHLSDCNDAGMATIVVKNIPAFVPDEAVRELLEHFGATSVRRTPIHSKYMGMAFADFLTKDQANHAVGRLANVKLGHSYVIAEIVYMDLAQQTSSHPQHQHQEPGRQRCEPIAPLLGLNCEADKGLEYIYPPATSDTVHNIAQTILAVPRLYTQVLHLMNKMNLPPPFHARDVDALPALTLAQRQWRDAKRARGLEPDESELGDSDELVDNDPPPSSTSHQNTTTLGEKRSGAQPQSSEMLVATCQVRTIKPQLSASKPPQPAPSKRFRRSALSTTLFQPPADDQRTRRGLYPRPGVITIEELEERRAPYRELEHLLSTSAEDALLSPSRTLYIKNLAKSVQESDLRYVFHIFFSTEEEAQRDLQVTAMQHGRMRRQAFVTFPSNHLASLALSACNGVIVDGKPIAMEFAKSSPQTESTAAAAAESSDNQR